MYRKTPGLGRVGRDPCLTPAVPSSRPRFRGRIRHASCVPRGVCYPLPKEGGAAIAGDARSKAIPSSRFARVRIRSALPAEGGRQANECSRLRQQQAFTPFGTKGVAAVAAGHADAENRSLSLVTACTLLRHSRAAQGAAARRTRNSACGL